VDLLASVIKFFESGLFRLSIRLFFLFIVVLWASLIYWTYRDAEKRGALALYWAAVVFVFNFFGWAVYLILRPPEYLDDARDRELEIRTKEVLLGKGSLTCPACLKPVEGDFLICPYCRKTLKKSCPSCNRPLETGWIICPYCKTAL